MGIGDALGNAYMRVEDAYYGVLDFFEEKGIGLPWTYNDFLESKGVPALPVTFALIMLVIGAGLVVATANQPRDVSFTLSLKDDKGRGLEDVTIRVITAQGDIIKTLTASDGTVISLEGLTGSGPLTIQASKQGYGNRSGFFYVGDDAVSLSLEGENDAVIGRLKLVDAETRTTITDATVRAEWAEGSAPLLVSPGADGIVLLNVPLNHEISLTVKADNYEELVDTITFSNADVKIKELTPKASASSGPSLLTIKAIDNQTQLPMDDVHVKIENQLTNETISDLDVASGIYSENLTKGLVVRVSVSKEGYLTYTSTTNFPEGKTLRKDEELILAPLETGGVNLLVHVQNGSSQQALGGADVDIMEEGHTTPLERQTSGFTGDVTLNGLLQTKSYTLLAFHPNFFPERMDVAWNDLPDTDEGKKLTLGLTPFTTGDAGVLTIFVTEEGGKAASLASVRIDEKVDSEWMPLLASRTVDSVGSFTARLKVGTLVRITAETENGSTSQETTITSGLNKVVLTLNQNTKPFTFNLSYANGKPFTGRVDISSNAENEWFSGNTTNGSVSALVPTNQVLTLTMSSTDGKKYSRTLTVLPEQEALSIVLDSIAGTTGDAPEMVFEGIVGADGQPLAGVWPQEDAFARFTLRWPANVEQGGFLVRVGEDSIASIDSQFGGIFGLNGETDTLTYGRSWTPTPAPGNEAKDRKTVGKAGTLSKWVEGTVSAPVGTQTIDVRLRVRSGTPEGTIPLYYRAFVQRDGKIVRMPADPAIGDASYTPAKSGLYAATQRATLPVYVNQPLCHGSICASIQLVDRDNRLIPIGGAQAQKGSVYAVQVNVLPGVSGSTPANTVSATPDSAQSSSGEGLIPLPNQPGKGGLTLKASTSNENPLLVFTKTELNTFAALADTGKKDTSVSVALPSADSPTGARARVHFLPEETGTTSLTLQLVSTNESWSETIPLEIVDPRRLVVTMPARVNPNEAIFVSVQDEQSNPLTNALITVTRADGTFAGSVKGTGTPGRGENGRYTIDKSFDAGIYGVQIHVPGFVDADETLVVGITDPLQLPEKLTIAIPFGQTSATLAVPVKNTTAFPISGITGEFQTVEGFPSQLRVEVGALAALAPNASGTMVVTATYVGEATDETVRVGSGILHVSGSAVQKYAVEAETLLSVGYNSPLDSSCLQFDKDRLSVYVMGESQPYGNLYNGTTSQANNVPYYGFSQTPVSTATNGQGYNAYGYNDAGYYQNAETKRLSVKATNNCGEELSLIPGISIVDGQAEVDGLKLAAVDSALKLGKGETKQVDFTLTNELYRAGFVPQSARYAATFRAAQLNASLPIDITFWDRSRALQTPTSIELTLIKTGTQKATDRGLVPIVNVGGGPIYDLRAYLEGTSASDVVFKLENNPSGASTSTSANTDFPLLASESNARGYLGPGQTLYPPLAIVAESTRETNGNAQKKLVLTGTIDGKRVTLKEIDVFARTGSSSCVEISSFDTPVSFISSELAGTIAKRITIQNRCLEPVRITGITPASAGTNVLSLTPLDGTGVLDKDAQVEYQLLLTKSTEINVQLTVKASGILVLSQRAIESNPLPIEVRLGKDQLQFSNASNPVEIPVCEGGTMSVRFPLLAKKEECSQAYCDAQQASGMLANVMEQTIAKVVQQMQSKRNDASEFPNCGLASGYCTFAQLGIKAPKIEVYLQNDTLTPQLLTYTLRDGSYPRLASMQAETLTALSGEGAESALLQKFGNGFGNKVFIPEIRGCGYYQFSLVGGVEVAANQLQPGQINAGFVLTNPKQQTAECQDKIYNAANFLPKDRSLSGSNTQGTLLGMVEYENASLREAGEWLAETVFGSDTRATNNTGSNRLQLRTGNLVQSIIEMTLDPATKGDRAKTIHTVIRETNGSVQKEAVIEAGKIITSLGKNVNGCITRDEQTWRIYSAKDVGEFTYEGCMLPGASEGGLAVRSTLTCCTLTTKSDILSEATYAIDPHGNTVPGLVSMDLYEVGAPATSITPAKPGNKIEAGAAYPLAFDTQSQAYVKSVLLCATADPATQQQANRAIVQTSATRTLDDTKAGPNKVQLRTCSLDADDALAKAYNKGTGTWYATIDWDDPAASKTILQTVEEATKNEKLGNAYVTYAGQGILANDNPVYKEKLSSQKLEGVMNFGLTCALTCGVCQGGFAVATFGAGLAASALDCALSCGTGTAAGAYEVYRDNAEGTILEKPRDIVEFTYGNVRDAALVAVPGSGANEAGASALAAGTLASGIKAGYKPFVDPKNSTQKLIPYADPAKVVKEDDLKFLDAVQGEVDARVNATRDIASEWNKKFVEATEDGSVAARMPLESEAIETQRRIVRFDDQRKKIVDGYDALIKKYDGQPGFDAAKYEKAKVELAGQLDALQGEADAIKQSIGKMELAHAKDSILLEAGESAKKIAKGSAESARKLTLPEKFYQTKTANTLANFGRSFVCGAAGSVAGYAAYRETLTKEIENKIELDVASDNVLDPQTNILTFNKGQTYKFIVQPAEGQGTSRKIFIDVVSPTAQLSSNVWLDDCSAK